MGMTRRVLINNDVIIIPISIIITSLLLSLVRCTISVNVILNYCDHYYHYYHYDDDDVDDDDDDDYNNCTYVYRY